MQNPFAHTPRSPFELAITEARQKRCVAAAIKREAQSDHLPTEVRMGWVVAAMNPIAEAARQGWDWEARP